MGVKEELLKIFEESGGRELSGQMLADKLCVSRTAVWKGISSLNSDGYRIEAGKGKGYRLLYSGDFLSAERVRTVIISEEQTGGRGRRGNSFFSPSGTGLYMSVILREAPVYCDTDLITICAGCGVCMAIEELTEKKPLIKWVNDVYLDGKKICGILSEATFDYEAKTIDSIVIGIGINITTADFPDGLDKKAGVIGVPIERAMLAAKVTECFFKCLKRTREENINDYKSLSLVLGREVEFMKEGRFYKAKAIDIDMEGQLIVESTDGVMKLNSGEISVKLQ